MDHLTPEDRAIMRERFIRSGHAITDACTTDDFGFIRTKVFLETDGSIVKSVTAAINTYTTFMRDEYDMEAHVVY